MTTQRERVNAILFSALIIISIVAGVAALGGSAAADDTPENNLATLGLGFNGSDNGSASSLDELANESSAKTDITDEDFETRSGTWIEWTEFGASNEEHSQSSVNDTDGEDVDPQFFSEDLEIEILEVSNDAVAPGGEIDVTIEHQSEETDTSVGVRNAIEYAQDRILPDRLLTDGKSVQAISSSFPNEDTHTLTYDALSTNVDGDPHGDDEIDLYAQTTDALEDEQNLEGESDPVTISLVENPSAEFFNIGQREPQPGETFVLDAIDSEPSDDDAIIEEYAWDLNDDGSFDEITLNPSLGHSFDDPGLYFIELQITDSNGLTDTTGNHIRVNDPPVAEFEFTPDEPVVEPGDLQTQVTFDASESEDPDVNGEITDYEWVFSGPNYYQRTGEETTIDLGAGTWDVELIVTDKDFGTDTAEETIEITEFEDADFTVDITDTNEPIEEGETLKVTAEIENEGDVSDTQTVDLDVSGLGTDSESVQLDGESTTTETFEVPTGSNDAGDYTAEVESEDESDSTSVRVNEPAFFAVEITDTNSPVEEGEDLEVTAEIENEGDVSDTQTVNLDVSGLGTDSETVQLNGGSDTTETFEVSTGSNDAGDYTAEVESEDESDSTSVEIKEPAFFAVEITDTNSPVEEGEDLEVTAEIENEGDVSDTQTIDIDILGLAIGDYSTTVTLDGSDTQTETFSIPTISGDSGDYTAEVESEDDNDSSPVRINKPVSFAMEIADTNSPVEVGDKLEATIQVENEGDVSGTQVVELFVPGLGTDSRSVSVDGSDTQTEIFSISTGSGDADNYTAAVRGEDGENRDTVPIRVDEPAVFGVEITDTNSPVEAGETLEVTAEIGNEGDVPDTQTVQVDVSGLGTDSKSVQLDGESATNKTFEFSTGSNDAGDYTAEVESEDDSDSTSVRVNEPAFFAIEITDTNSPVEEGEDLEATAEIENTGDESDSQTVELAVDGLDSDSTSVSLDGGDSATETLSVDTEAGDADDYTAEVTSDDDSATAPITIQTDEDDPFFAIDIINTNSPVEEGETLEVTAEVENEGDEFDEQEVSLDIDETETDTQTVELEGYEKEEIILEWETIESDAGDYTAEVRSDDDSTTISITVTEDEEDPDTGIVTGTITSANGDQLDGVEIKFVDPDTDEVETTATSDETGEYSTEVSAEQTYEIAIEEAGYKPFSMEITVEPDETHTVDIELVPETGKHPSGVDQEVWDAVTDLNDPSDELTFQDLVDSIQAYQDGQSVEGVELEFQDLVDLIEWYQG